MLLAIDTATRLLSLALHDGEELRAECSVFAGRRHNVLLAPMIERMLAQTGTNVEALSALAVASGPGSYTGLRSGLALAKGMAAVRDLPLVTATTLEVIVAASSGADRTLPLAATVPAGRKRIIWAVYRADDGDWRETGAAQLGSWEELLADCAGPFTINGEIAREGLERLREANEAGRRIVVPTAAERLRRAGYLAEIAWDRLRVHGHRAYPAELAMPVYLKAPG